MSKGTKEYCRPTIYKSTSGQYGRNEAMIIPQISPINKPEGKFIIAVKELHLSTRTMTSLSRCLLLVLSLCGN